MKKAKLLTLSLNCCFLFSAFFVSNKDFPYCRRGFSKRISRLGGKISYSAPEHEFPNIAADSNAEGVDR